jgi:hypothetical protein
MHDSMVSVITQTQAALLDFVAHTQQLVERKLEVGMMFYDIPKTRSNWNTWRRLTLVQKLHHRSNLIHRCEWSS